MSHFSELGYIRVLIDENMLRLFDFERFSTGRNHPVDKKVLYGRHVGRRGHFLTPSNLISVFKDKTPQNSLRMSFNWSYLSQS